MVIAADQELDLERDHGSGDRDSRPLDAARRRHARRFGAPARGSTSAAVGTATARSLAARRREVEDVAAEHGAADAVVDQAASGLRTTSSSTSSSTSTSGSRCPAPS